MDSNEASNEGGGGFRRVFGRAWSWCVFYFDSFNLRHDSITDVTVVSDGGGSNGLEQVRLRLAEVERDRARSVLGKARRQLVYVVPFLVLIGHQIDTFAQLAQADFVYSRLTVSEMVSRKFNPPELWFQSDGLITSGIFVEMAVFGLLAMGPRLPGRFRAFALRSQATGAVAIYSNGQFWPEDYVRAVVRFRSRIRPTITATNVFGLFLCMAYWWWNVYRQYNGTWRDLAIALYVPVFAWFSNFGVVMFVASVILPIRYFHIRQQTLVGRLQAFTSEAAIKTNQGKGKSQTNPSQAMILRERALLWHRFCSNNRQLLTMNLEQRAASRHWSPYMSAIFAGYMVMVTFMLYGMIAELDPELQMDKEVDGVLGVWRRSFFSFYALECLGLMLLTTRQCARVATNHMRIFKANTRFCYVYTKVGSEQGVRHNPIPLLQMSKLISNHRGAKNGFRLINNFLVDNRMYEVIAFYMITMYMVAVTRERIAKAARKAL